MIFKDNLLMELSKSRAKTSNHESTDVVEHLLKLKTEAEELCLQIESLNEICGMPKLLRKCKAELQFLDRIFRNPGKVSHSHLNSSNLAHIQGILQAVKSLCDVSEILRPFRLQDLDHPIHVDVICDYGSTWVKVVARNSKALLVDTTGQHAFGEKTIVDQAKQFLQLALLYPHNYASPRILFYFFHTVPQKLKRDLNKLGIIVWENGKPSSLEFNDSSRHQCLDKLSSCASSDITFSSSEDEDLVYSLHLKDDDNISDSRETSSIEECLEGNSDMSMECFLGTKSCLRNFCSVDCTCAKYFKQDCDISSGSPKPGSNVFGVKRVNLDITTLFALVSNLCHGRCEFVFQEKILTEQATEERSCSALKELITFLCDKQLFVCKTALDDFQNILATVGGPKEKERAHVLLQYITVVPDCQSLLCQKLLTTSKLSARAKTIFGTGDALKAVTTTANRGFVRAAAQSSADFVVFLHAARALTEQKESTAVGL